MTSQDHNKTLGIIYGVLGGLLTIGAIVELVRVIIIEKELARIQSDSYLMPIILGLLLLIILVSTSYGLFKRRRWARILSLVLAGLFVLLFPLGTALSIYTWWFMHSDGAKLLYSESSF
jgi:phosphoglycerol transferase MdoB-like AlkP superfamily enzyme